MLNEDDEEMEANNRLYFNSQNPTFDFLSEPAEDFY